MEKPKKPFNSPRIGTSLFGHTVGRNLGANAQTDKDDDDGRSGGKQTQLQAGIIESAIKKSKADKKQKKDTEANATRQEKIDRETSKKTERIKLAEKYLQSLLAIRAGFKIGNIDPSALKDAKYKAFQSHHRSVEMGIQPSLEEQLHYAQITGSITGTLSGASGKSITAMESEGPISNWHGVQYISAHASLDLVPLMNNPHAPARHYVLTGGHTEASSSNYTANGRVPGLLFQQQQATPSSRLPNMAYNRYTGFSAGAIKSNEMALENDLLDKQNTFQGKK
ncbi:MAG: hypothetical protein COW05_01065 [Gammaproteobacteria bacterium CG12_big_fil_rev_8_21_14_0_65_46_12]|nr:MAG: hypothetical protein COW05_01065 [Gammaproteobacteria bacterium CG12_big_fil_rev_8_21_14_0_65_46_12]